MVDDVVDDVVGDADALRRQQREVRAAVTAVGDALYRVNQALGELGVATDLARADFWGGGLVTSSMKRERVDRVGTLVRSVELALSEVRDRLDVLGFEGTHALRVDQVRRTSTVDVWLHNLLSDVRSRYRLKKAYRQLDVAARSLVRIQSELGRRDSSLAQRLGRAGT